MAIPNHLQDDVQRQSLADPVAFWARQAKQLSWSTPPTSVLETHTRTLASGATHPSWSWFGGGELNTCYNCVDRHVAAGHGDAPAIHYDSPVTDSKQTLTYAQLLDEVEVLAAVLRDEGVRKGDTVLLYMPMIPQALVALLAIVRLGAVHAVVFGGFAAAALAQRIEASGASVVMTASCGVEGSKGAVAYEPMVRGAIQRSSVKPRRTIVWQRDQLRWENIRRDQGERQWNRLVKSARARGMRAGPVACASQHPVYIIYTSGTTGTPKGVVRETGGHLVGLQLSVRYLFGIGGPGDVLFTASDIGWVVGHSYICYAPLLVGAATVLFEGKPVGTPDAGTFWRIVREYRVNALFTAPTALRAMRRDDPDGRLFERAAAGGGLASLRALFLAGERSEPAIVEQYGRLLGRHCAPGAQVVDNWWSSESGSPISGLALDARAAGGDAGGDGGGGGSSTGVAAAASQQPLKPLPTKAGSAGKPMPGFDVRIVDDDGGEVSQGAMGNIVLALPLAPTGLTTLWRDDERFYRSYLRRFGARWLDTGDAGMLDGDGYLHVMARSDDIINVAAHRFSTGAIEQAVTSHPGVAEACVVGIPDALKGSLPFAFATLSAAEHPESAVPDAKLLAEVQALVREQIGAIAQLGGMVVGRGMIPRTRSGKTLRRVLRELLENAVHGELDKAVSVPATVEDAAVVEVARQKIRQYFGERGGRHGAIERRTKL